MKMKSLVSILAALTMISSFSTSAFATDTTTFPTDSATISQEEATSTEKSTRGLYSTGVIAGGGTNYTTIFRKDPWTSQNWTIGRSSGTAGKIDIEVRDEAGRILGSKAFYNDGDEPLTVYIPWDCGECSVRVYNNNSYAGSWVISIST